MFIDITKDGSTINVAKDAFLNYFSNLGWVEGKPSTPAKKEIKKEVKEVEPVIEEKDEWADVIDEDDGIEKPISEMSRKELIEYAESKGIDVSGLDRVSQIREVIKKAM